MFQGTTQLPIGWKNFLQKTLYTVILPIFGVVLFSVVNGFTEIKKNLNAKNTLSDQDSIHEYRNLNYTERSAIAHHRNFNAPKICKITVMFKLCST